jgi:hypothetical protein
VGRELQLEPVWRANNETENTPREDWGPDRSQVFRTERFECR